MTQPSTTSNPVTQADMATETVESFAAADESVCSDAGPSSAASGISRASATSAATSQSTGTTLSRASSKSSLTDLPASAYDGSHLHWKTFRQHVLGPHRIRVLENPPQGHLPDSFLSLVEAQSINTERFNAQKQCFREQVNEGRGFGPSPLFPPNLLPSIEDMPQLARCMVPGFQRDALPLRALNHAAPFYELSIPRPGLGCGFSSFAFSSEEIAILPSYLVGTGTSVDFSTGYISPSHAVYCGFLVFERAFGKKEHRLEAANNQCAIGGAYCCRALQMLYSEAYKAERVPTMPVTFSCTVDNDFAIINYHWIDHEQAYHMAPLCKFDLRQDEHFSHFAAWIEAIGQWAMAYVLPQIKEALARLQKGATPSPGYIDMKAAKKLTLLTESNKNDMLIQSLKTAFDNIPWRFEDDEFTPVSSATASWGSPMIDDMIISSLSYPNIPKGRGIPITLAEGEPVGTPRPSLADIRMSMTSSPPVRGTATPPPPAYTHNPELVSHRRLDHAMDEIRDLQGQLQIMKGSNTGFRQEISGLRNTLSTILRKESATVRTRSLLSRRVSSPDFVPASPTDADATNLPFSKNILPSQAYSRQRRPEMLQINTAIGSTPSSSLNQSTLPGNSPPTPERPPVLTLSCNGVDVMLSPTSVKRTQSSARPSFDSHKSPLSARAPPWANAPRTPMTAKLVALPPSPPPTPRKMPWYLVWYHTSTPETKIVLRWASAIISGYVLCNLIPYNVLTFCAVGCAADYMFRNFMSPAGPGTLGLRSTRFRSELGAKKGK